MHRLLSIEVRRPGRPAIRAGLDSVDITVGADLAAPRLLCHSNDGRQGTGLGADFAPKAFAETALDASAPPGSWLRKDRHWRGEWMPTELPGGTFENDAARFHRQWRQRIGLGPRWIKRASAGKARDADFPFHFGVIRLKLSVSYGPVRES